MTKVVEPLRLSEALSRIDGYAPALQRVKPDEKYAITVHGERGESFDITITWKPPARRLRHRIVLIVEYDEHDQLDDRPDNWDWEDAVNTHLNLDDNRSNDHVSVYIDHHEQCEDVE